MLWVTRKRIRGRTKRQLGQSGQRIYGKTGVVIACVQTGSKRRRTEIELVEAFHGRLGCVGSDRQARCIAAELLAQRDRDCVLQMGPTNFEHIGEFDGFGGERVSQRTAFAHEGGVFERQRDPRGGREHVIGGLTHVDVIVRMDLSVGASGAAEQLRGAVGEDFVGVHVVRRPRTGLVDVDDELITKLTAQDLVGRGDDGIPLARIEPLERAVGLRRGALDEHRGPDEAVGRGQAADRKVRARAGGLDAVVRLSWYFELAEGITLNSRRHDRNCTVLNGVPSQGSRTTFPHDVPRLAAGRSATPVRKPAAASPRVRDVNEPGNCRRRTR